MTDGFLRSVPSDTNPADGRLYDPTVADSGTPGTAIVTALVLALALGSVTATGRASAAPAALATTETLQTTTATGKGAASPSALTLTGTLQNVVAKGRASAAPAALTATDALQAGSAKGKASASPAALSIADTLQSGSSSGAATASPTALASSFVLQPGSASAGSGTPGNAAVTPLSILLVLQDVTADGNHFPLASVARSLSGYDGGYLVRTDVVSELSVGAIARVSPLTLSLSLARVRASGAAAARPRALTSNAVLAHADVSITMPEDEEAMLLYLVGAA